MAADRLPQFGPVIGRTLALRQSDVAVLERVLAAETSVTERVLGGLHHMYKIAV